MNNLFKKEDKVHLNDNWYLTTDGFKGVTLVNHFQTEREKVQTIGGKKVKTGEKETITEESRTYHATVGQALDKFITTSLSKPSATLEEILETHKEISSVVEEFKQKYKNW